MLYMLRSRSQWKIGQFHKFTAQIIHLFCDITLLCFLQNVINGIGGVHALFPILENASKSDEGPDLSFLSPSVEKECRLIEGHESSMDSDDWEILPSSSYSGKIKYLSYVKGG